MRIGIKTESPVLSDCIAFGDVVSVAEEAEEEAEDAEDAAEVEAEEEEEVPWVAKLPVDWDPVTNTPVVVTIKEEEDEGEDDEEEVEADVDGTTVVVATVAPSEQVTQREKVLV